jgi:protein-tyrosine phosphatase
MWLSGKHYVGPDPEHALQETGATTIVCLTEAFEIDERYPQYVSWLRANEAGRAVWFPIPDLHAPSPAGARALLDDMLRRLTDGEGLLVHCGAGIGRSGTIAAAVLISLGTSLPEALATVAANRPMAGPEGDAQRELLDALAAGSD